MRSQLESGRRNISIHALHEESDRWREHPNWVLSIFQSTLSMRRATHQPNQEMEDKMISIHALHEESDRASAVSGRRPRHFNPRSP